jgi:flavin-dependent thymidylate synthase
MKVSLINYTGFGHPDPHFAAKLLAYTKATRLEQGEEGFARFLAMTPEELQPQLDYIAGTLRSSWEFIDFQFQINGVTRAFTHQFVRTRTASYAQQAQRVVDLTDVGVSMPDTVAENPAARAAWDEACSSIKSAYSAMQAAGIPNQDCRGIVPTNILTNITAKINLRTLADLVGKRQNLRAQGEYADVVRGMVACVLEVMPWAEAFLYPDRLATPALDGLLKDALGSSGPLDKPHINEALKELDKLKATWG